MTSRQLVILLALALTWGSSFLFISVLVDADIDPLGVSAARVAIGSLVLAPIAWIARSQFPRDRRTWLMIAALGVFNFAVPWTLFPVSQQHIPSGVASIANSSTPLFASVFAALLVPGERLTARRVAGLGFGFVGISVLMAGDIGGIGAASVWGILGVLLSTLLYGISAVIIRLRMSHVRAIPLTVGQIGVAAAVLVPAALGTNAYGDARMGGGEWASLLALGGIGSGIAVVAYMNLIGTLGPVRASVVTYLMPPIGVFLGWLVLDEAIGWTLVLASALIVSGVALVQNVALRSLPAAAVRRFGTPTPTPIEP